MQTEHEVPAGAAGALVAHLRQKPEDALCAPQELADRFGLEPLFVRNVLDAARFPATEETSGPRASPFAFLGTACRSAACLFDRLTSRPLLFVLGSTGVAALLGMLAIRLGAHGSITVGTTGTAVGVNPRPANWQAVALGVLILLTMVLHMATYYRRAMSRHAVLGGLALFLLFTGYLSYDIWTDRLPTGAPSRLVLTGFVMLGMFFLCLLYTGLGSLMSVLGGWRRMRSEERAEEQMTRQDLLERYFELQSRMQGYPRATPAERSIADWPGFHWLAQNPFLASFLLGVVLSLISVLAMAALHLDPVEMQQAGAAAPPSPETMVAVLIPAVVGIIIFLAYLLMGFLSGTALRAVGCALMMQLGSFIPSMLPVRGFGLQSFLRPEMLLGNLLNTVIFALMAAVAGLGATVQRRAARKASLARNDPATVVAEMLRIQWRLAGRSTRVCVMFVDAAKSAEMKANADPLAIEYSFREYQEWVAGVIEGLRGRVHSTAGDGAVASFPTPADAFLAARRLQTDLARFNAEVNRLPSPFRLRIGLHTDEVAGDLGKVEFAEVIDIAAHVQAASPIGGIAATEETVENLAREEFVPLADAVDGHRVYLALNPTEG